MQYANYSISITIIIVVVVVIIPQEIKVELLLLSSEYNFRNTQMVHDIQYQHRNASAQFINILLWLG